MRASGRALYHLFERTCRVVVIVLIVVTQLKVQLIIFCHDGSPELLPQLRYLVVGQIRTLCHPAKAAAVCSSL